jgi:glucose/arabinose dehydrogenase
MKTTRAFSLITAVIAIAILFSCKRNQPAGAEQNRNIANMADTSIKVPEGFIASIFADDLGRGRHITIGANGNVYLALREYKNNGGIVALKDNNGDGKADSTGYFWNTLTTGIELKNGYLYYSNFDEVFRVPLADDELVPQAEPEVIVTGFPKQDQHQDKTFTFDNDGNIYVNVGAPSNACQEKDRIPGSKGIDPCPQLDRHAGIWRFKADKTNQDQVKDGHRYASGIRNSIALTWNTDNNKLYVVQHGRDQLFQFYPELFTEQQGAELPAEEFLLVEDGDYFGWPYCYYDQIQNMKLLAPEYGGDTKMKGRCEEAKDPIMSFPAHIAPNDILFYNGTMFPEKYKKGAFIAFHGSWNRAPLDQKGYFVAFIPFSNGMPSGEWEIFAEGFAGMNPVTNMNDVVYRPTGLAEGPDGSIYVADSQKGRIWKIVYSGI